MVDRFFEGGLEERLEGWIDRGREFVDGVAANAAASNRPRSSFAGSSSNARRRPLDAISRRGQRPAAPSEPAPGFGLPVLLRAAQWRPLGCALSAALRAASGGVQWLNFWPVLW